ncbi:hypothetical protein Micbo1qcDRAFT_28415 [Microdochium bolleyi]|uniref:RING zinc finger-like domain-containing protein n=1 Tax=Microdochium bolleyi TaxID=196109 RepID=A0A136JEY9_9PEZI|nr:hypothetical protein Micbo1qcDRAFT_28415 [Microdochium bolleyi]
MPPRSSLTSSFSITDANNEVVCPLYNQDHSSCRKRCIGEKRYRSMQEHIRRAHPEHYIAKLPATEESFLLMINTPPSDKPQNQSTPSHHQQNRTPKSLEATKLYHHDRHGFMRDGSSAPGTPRHMDDYGSASLLPAASAAAALAQLGQQHKLEHDWDSDAGWHSDIEGHGIPRSTIELPPIHDPTSDPYSSLNAPSRRDLLPSILSNSPPGRSSTLPPLHRSLGPSRPRKQSISKRSHKKQKSRGTTADWFRRIRDDDYLRIADGDRKAQSVEPSTTFGKRWEDLIDAAASATEDIDEDRTPIPRSPVSVNRASLPPLQQHFHAYQASPLQQQALTPPSFVQELADPFPSVESGESGDTFHITASGLSDSSPSYSSQDVHIYCAACQRTSRLKESYACTECICGICRDCVNILMEEQGARRKCPRCATVGGRFKPFQLDFR